MGSCLDKKGKGNPIILHFLLKNLRGWSFLIKGTRLDEQLWGSEKFSRKNMGMRNSFGEKYGGAKYFWDKLWGCEIFSHFVENSSDWVPGIKKDQPLSLAKKGKKNPIFYSFCLKKLIWIHVWPKKGRGS